MNKSNSIAKTYRKLRLSEHGNDFDYWQRQPPENDWKPSRPSEQNITRGNMKLNPDFKEFFRLLNAHNVRYLIIGGYAVAFHSYPRFTKDIDVWIWIDPENAERVVQTLKT